MKKVYLNGQFLPGHVVPQGVKDKIRKALTGRKLPQRTIDKIRRVLKGRPRPKFSDEWRANLSRAHIGKNHGTKNGRWNGTKTNYFDIHKWVNRNWGRPRKCEQCKTSTAKTFEWANLDKKYDRLRRDSWKRLCKSCHVRFDRRKRVKIHGTR